MGGSALGSHALGPAMAASYRELPRELQELSSVKREFSLVKMDYLFARLWAHTLENHLACLQESNNKATCAGKGEVRLSHWPAITTPRSLTATHLHLLPTTSAAYAPTVMQMC